MSRKKIIGDNSYQALTTNLSNHVKRNIFNNINNQESNCIESDNDEIKHHRRNLSMNTDLSINLIDSKNKSINTLPTKIIYEQIKKKLENIMSVYCDKVEILSEILTEILNAINFTVDNFSSYSERSNDLFLTQNNKSKLSIDSKILYLLQIQKLEQEIKKLKEKLDFFYSIFNKYEPSDKNKYLTKVFQRKFNEQKNSSKKKEFKYLFCLKEQEKKINELENKLLLSNLNTNYDKDAIKSVLCFPNYQHYELKEHINPKSIPLYKIFQQMKINSNKNYKINSFSTRKRNKSIKINEKSSEGTTNNYIDKTCSHKAFFIKNYNTQENIENNFTKKKKQKGIQTLTQKKLKKYFIEEKYNNNTDVYRPRTILNNDKEYFVSHPNLEKAGYPSKKEVRYEGLPKKILRFKLHKYLEKSLMVTFPSSVNEALVNLQKLKK